MPAFNQAAFLPTALASLYSQTFIDWELIAVDDGSTDTTCRILDQATQDPRCRHFRLGTNRGLGAALNWALDQARGDLIAYLPCDDLFYPEHLARLVAVLAAHPEAMLAYSGVRYHQHQTTYGPVPERGLQLVQVMHRRTPQRWIERIELVTNDLERMFWTKAALPIARVATECVTAEWVDHPQQRHKFILEPLGGGLNPYRQHYGVAHPLCFHSTAGNFTDEPSHYRCWRERPSTPPAPDGLKILLVGELAFNPERILALEERGHQLYGLWTPKPWWFNTVGPLPFGHVTEVPRQEWRQAIRHLKPDLIYALLNWQAVPFAHEVLMADLGIPLVWHFKEGPWLCRAMGSWPELVDLQTRSAGQIYISPEQRDWFEQMVPGSVRSQPTLLLDGDLPKADWFTQPRSERLSTTKGGFHTVVPGRPIGLKPELVRQLADQDIHLHFYGDVNHSGWRQWTEEAQGLAAGYLHLHSHVGQDRWVSELSQYDAGWLHFLPSNNGGDLRRACWDDLNYPARIATLAVAGLPVIQYDNQGAVVATQTLAHRLDIGLFCQDMAELGSQLRDTTRLTAIQENVWQVREQFTFDYHADRLVDFFRQVIAHGSRG
ncbi:glycosyltransferase [Candidatus Cyanaurora vandensis]|uniref:glycosyltransferase n=1 Tax=Candidatus Cyanaurora vandensis TaxID=2714958 RepID=UPI0037BE88A3